MYLMNKIYKYTHKQKTVRSLVVVLPAFLLVIAAFIWRFGGIQIARQYLQLNLQLPILVQLLIWIVLPLWSLWQARKAYKYGTIRRYRKYNILALFMSTVTLFVFASIIAGSFL